MFVRVYSRQGKLDKCVQEVHLNSSHLYDSMCAQWIIDVDLSATASTCKYSSTSYWLQRLVFIIATLGFNKCPHTRKRGSIAKVAYCPEGCILMCCYDCFNRDKKEITQKFDHSWKPSKSTVSCALMYEIYVDNSWTGEYTISSFSMAKYKSFFSSYSTA